MSLMTPEILVVLFRVNCQSSFRSGSTFIMMLLPHHTGPNPLSWCSAFPHAIHSRLCHLACSYLWSHKFTRLLACWPTFSTLLPPFAMCCAPLLSCFQPNPTLQQCHSSLTLVLRIPQT